MKFLFFILILVTIWTQFAEAADPHHDMNIYMPPVNDTSVITNITSADSNYGLMALSSSGLVFDCCRPGKLQWAGAMAFTEGGNQSFSGGLASNLSKTVLLNARLAATIDTPNNEDDYAVIVGLSGAFD